MFAGKASGRDFEYPQWTVWKEALPEGDVLVGKSIDRFGRDYEEAVKQWRDATKCRGVAVVVLDMPLLDARRECRHVQRGGVRFSADLDGGIAIVGV